MVFYADEVDTEEVLMQLALALRYHRGILKMDSDRKVIDELGHLAYLYVVATQPRDTLLALQISGSRIKYTAVKTLCRLLEANLIGELSFQHGSSFCHCL
jgi:hypothetical protein